MSYLHSSSAFHGSQFIHEPSAARSNDGPEKPAHTTDRAIDSALRSVPLPSGLMTRLGKLAYTLSDETADQVDWLGC